MKFHDIWVTTQEKRWTVSRLTRLFHGLPSRRGGVSVSNIMDK